MDVPTHVHFTDLDTVEILDMAASDAISKLGEKIDDIRSGQVTFAIEQAKMAGRLEAMEGQLSAMQRTLADINTLREQITTLKEKVRAMEAKEFRGWVERLVAGAAGGGLAAAAQYLLK